MADEIKTIDQTEITTVGERTVTPLAAWQTAPPGPAGAAIDPPPCIAPKSLAAPIAAFRSIEDDPFRSPNGPTFGVMHMAHMFPPTPAIPGKAAEPALIGKQTGDAQMEKLLRESGWKPNNHTPNHGT